MEKIPTPQKEVIYLPENREPLQEKLNEYKSRPDTFKAPELQFSTLYKIAVLESLIRDGVVNRTEVIESLREKYGSVDEQRFHNAWGVITDYVNTGGKNLFGGTGLPSSKEDNLG